MNILIAYASKHGSSEKAALMLKEKLTGTVDLHNFKKGIPNIHNFDAIIIGGSIHMGEIQKNVKTFFQKNSDLLEKKHLGLFLCCMDKERAQLQFEKAFPEELREQAIVNSLFGGEFNFEKMNWFERKIIKKISGVSKTVSEIDIAAIDRFANKFNLLTQ